MKKQFMLLVASLAATVLLSGCLALKIGGGESKTVQSPTVGQQLIDLQAAKDAGALTEDEFAAEKRRALGRE